MVYQLKLLFVVAVFSFLTALAAWPAFRNLLSKTQYRIAWQIVALAAAVSFLSRFTSIYFVGVAITGFAAYRMLGADLRARVAAFLMLILLFPPVSQSLAGVGEINQLFILDHVRMLSLVLLLPAAFQLFTRRRVDKGNPFLLVDLLIVAYKALEVALMMRNLTYTAVARLVFESFMTVLLPYYVTTRSLRSIADLRFVATYFMIGLVFMAGIGVGESVIQHGMYAPLAYIYGVKWQLTHELLRGGLLRVQSTTPEPIGLATLMIVALGVWTWLVGAEWRRPRSLVIYALILAASLSTWSRGPWVCTVIFAASLLVTRFFSSRVYIAALVGTAVVCVIAKMTGADQAFYDGLKLVFGSSQAEFGSIEYRRQVLDASIALLQQSPMFGVSNYGAYLQQFRQGEGIVDLVNTYIIVALNTGLVGLALYLAPQVIVLFKLASRLDSPNQDEPHDRFVGCFASVLLAISVVLLTTSIIGVLDQMLLAFVALSLVYIRCRNEMREPEPLAARNPIPTYGRFVR